MQAAAGVSSTRTAPNKTKARFAGELAIGLGHIKTRAFVSAYRQRYFWSIVEGIEGGKKTLAGDAEYAINRIDLECIDEYLCTGLK